MLIVVALGGNALSRRGEPADAALEQSHVVQAAHALAPIAAQHSLVICHGNGPQIGILATETENDNSLAAPFPLDTLGAQTQGMIGYWLAQELGNAGVRAQVAALVTRTVVDSSDQAFQEPTKFIGPTYHAQQAAALERHRGWHLRPDGTGWRRVVASPEPVSMVELEVVRGLLANGVLVVCGGGGGVPVVLEDNGTLRGTTAVVDKDLTASMIATELGADRFIILTDVSAVMRNFGELDQAPVTSIPVQEISGWHFPEGSMAPKIEACRRFVTTTSKVATIGALEDATALLTRKAGTSIEPAAVPA